MNRPGLVACMVLGAMLAGCGGGPEQLEGRSEAAGGFDEFEEELAGEEFAIRGVVTDEAIVPQAGVNVALDDGRNLTTTDHGTFAFAVDHAGAYVVRTTKSGLLEATTTVEVRARDDPLVRIVMMRDAELTPYHQVLHIDMFLQCGASGPNEGEAFSVCQSPNGASDIACSLGGVCVLGHPMEHRGLIEVDPGRGAPRFAQAEAVWEATNPTAEKLQFLRGARQPGALDWGNNSSTHIGPSPIIMPWNETQLIDDKVGQGHVFAFQAYPSGGSVGVVLNQQIDLYVTTTYHFTPKDGWTFFADGEPSPP